MSIVKYQLIDRVAYLTLNRPEKRNALNPELIEKLKHTFKEASADNQVKVIVVKALGKAFSAGADLAYLKQLQNNSYEENITDTNALKDLFYTIYTSPKMTIAQIEGHAIAGGCGLASVCDVAFSVPEAKFGYTEVKIGFIPALVACFLVRKLGENRVRELLLSGELINAQTALAYGLINFVVDKDNIDREVSSYAKQIVHSTSAQSIALTKSLLSTAYNSSLEDSLKEAVLSNAQVRSSEDFRRGIEIFLSGTAVIW